MRKYDVKNPDVKIQINIEDMSFIFNPFMAGSELLLTQKQRRSQFLNKKIDTLMESAKTAEDFDQIEKVQKEADGIEIEYMDYLKNLLTPTGDNKEKGEQYLSSKTIFELAALIELIKDQAENGTTA